MLRRVRPFLVALVSLAALSGGRVEAAERQHHVALGPHVSAMNVRDHGVNLGVGAELSYTYGLTDQFNLLGQASHTVFGLGARDPAEAPQIRPGFHSRGAVGAAYVLDVLRWVPYGGVLVSGNALGGGTLGSAVFVPGAEVILGLDYQVSRSFVLGGGYRQSFLLTKLPDYPVHATLFAKLEWQWGF